MDNRNELVGKVDAFVTKAKNVGVFNPSQTTNLMVALNLVKDQLKKSGADPDSWKVGDLLDNLDRLLDEYGGESKASFQTIATYKGRAKKVLTDFATWNGGDFMAWKTQLAKDASSKASRKPEAKAAPGKAADTTPPPGGSAPKGTEQVLEIRLSGSRTGKLVLPDPLTQKDIDAAWKQIEAYKGLLETRIDIDGDDDEQEDEA